MLDNREQRHKVYSIMRRLGDEYDLVPFITLKHLSQKQEESKDNLGEFIDEYGFYFRDYELLSNIIQKQENDDESYLSDFKSSINALKNASNEYIKEIYSRIPNKTLNDDVLSDILIMLKYAKDSKRLYFELTRRPLMMLRRREGVLPSWVTRVICDIVKEDHDIKNVYNPTCRDAETIKCLQNFESATLYEKDEQMYYRAIQNLIINDIPMNKITIANKEMVVLDGHMRFDAIISTPNDEVKGRITSDLSNLEIYGYETKNREALHLFNLINHLAEEGILIMVTSLDLLVKRDTYNLREVLIEDNLVESIIEYDRSYRNSKNIILIIRKNKESDDILFIKQDDDTFRRQMSLPKFIEECYRLRNKIDRFSDIITNDEIKENDYNLNPKRYVYTLDYEPKDLGELTSKQHEYTSQIRQLDEEIEELLDKISKL